MNIEIPCRACRRFPETLIYLLPAQIFWNFPFSTTAQISANKPDMVVLHHSTKELYVIGMSRREECIIAHKKLQKKTKYTDLLFQLRLSYLNYIIKFIPLIIRGIQSILIEYI